MALLAPMLVFAGGCASFAPLTGTVEESAADESLTRVVSELKLHLRDDTYRYDRAVAPDGRNVYAVALWKLDRLAGLRAKPEAEWENADYVVEFARAKALERLRRYGEALAAFQRVAASGSVLGDAASERARVMESFALAAAPPDAPFASPDEERSFIDGKIGLWRRLAEEVQDTPHEPLALEEIESWQVMRVDSFARSDRLGDAIASCEKLIESNRDSKLYAKHLLRLGDLYAASARRASLQARANLASLDPAEYETLLDQA